MAADLPAHKGKKATALLYFITHKVVPTVNGQTMAFGSFIDARTEWVDTVHFPPSFRNYPLKGQGFYKVTGKVVEDFGVFSVEVESMYKVGYKPRKEAKA
jgi:DNA polymerase-3 subunit alpha